MKTVQLHVRFDQHTAISDIIEERRRQVEEEHFDKKADDTYTKKELARYAVATLLLGIGFDRAAIVDFIWPKTWFQRWLKDAPYRRLLVKAGAAIVAEIERVDRLSSAPETRSNKP